MKNIFKLIILCLVIPQAVYRLAGNQNSYSGCEVYYYNIHEFLCGRNLVSTT